MTKDALGRGAWRHPFSVVLPVAYAAFLLGLVWTHQLTMQVAGSVMLITAGGASTLYVLYFLIFMKWAGRRETRTIVALLSVLTVILDLFASVQLGWLSITDKSWPFIRFGVYAGILVVIWWLAALMVSRQHEARVERRSLLQKK